MGQTTLKYIHGGTHGEISGLPDQIFALTPAAGYNGVSFIDYSYAEPGHGTHSVIGLQVGIGIPGPTTSFSFSEDASRGEARVPGRATFFLRGPGQFGHASWDGHHRARILSLVPSAVERMFGVPLTRIGLPQIVADSAEYEGIAHLLAALTSSPIGGQTDPLFVESVALAIIRATGLVPNEETGKTRTLSPVQAGRIRDLIASQLTHSLSLRDMATAVGLSESYFVRAFKGTFGVTPYQYVLRERVALAQSLIQVGELSLNEIAQLSGFPDARRMGRTFRQVTGRSPTGSTKTKRKATH